MTDVSSAAAVRGGGGGGGEARSASSASMGKGAWDCDARKAIPPEKEAEVFEEIPTMDFPFHGIPTVPPRKDMAHMTFFCRGTRYRVTAEPEWPSSAVKRALWDGGIARSNRTDGGGSTPGIRGWRDLTLIYAGQVMEDDRSLASYGVPRGCQALIAIETARLSAPPDPDSPFWEK